MSTAKQHILKLLASTDKMHLADLCRAIHMKRSAINSAIEDLTDRGEIQRIGAGMYRLKVKPAPEPKPEPKLPVFSSGFIRPLTRDELMRGK